MNWIRAAAIIARIDPVAAGYLARDPNGRLLLPALRGTGSFRLRVPPGQPPPFLPEFTIHQLSDANFYLSVPAAYDLGLMLEKLAPEFGFDPNDHAAFNNNFRNPVLSYLSAERLIFIYAREGLDGVRREVRHLRTIGMI